MSLVLPCPMRAYRGTKWYKRLVTAEYAVMLDSGSARESIRDRSLDSVPRTDPRLADYREGIRAAFSAPDGEWDATGPFATLRELRRLKSSLFEPTEIDWSCLAPKRDPSAAWIDPLGSDGLAGYLAGASRLILVADCDRTSLAEACARTFRDSLGVGVPVDIALGPSVTPWPRTLSEGSAPRLPGYWELEASDLESLYEGGAAVACADPRYAFGFVALGLPFVSLLDCSDWYSAALHGQNRDDDDDGIAVPAASGFSGLLTKAWAERSGYRFRFWNEARSEEERSGMLPIRHRDAGIPAWAADGELGVDAEARFFGPAVGGGWERRPGPGEGAVHVSFASLEPSSVRIEPVFFDSMSPPPVTGEKALYCSFNYYMTDNLLEWYSENDRRPIAWRRFPLDYVYVTGEAAGFESPPLYRKTLLGCTSSGRLVAGAYSFSSVTLRDGRGDVVGRFSGEALDPADPDAPGLFLPGKGPRRVGAGLHCTSFIHDEPWDSRPGPVEVPPFGVVVASASPLAGAGRFSWSVEWADLPCAKEELSWLMGGFNCLVEDGVDLCPTVTAAAERLEREGWTNPLSTQTQETQLEADIRQPRCCVGWTRGGQAIVMAVSGRSALSAGARFGDLSSLASLLAAERGDGLEFLVNVDGGASAMLCAVGDGERAMLSYPSPSDNNPAGVARKVPSLLRIAILEKP